MSVYKTAVLLAATCLSIGTVADTITTNPGDATSSIDLFNGATVVNWSNILGGMDVNDAFGSSVGPTEPGSVIGNTDTSDSWLHFRTASSVSANQFTITLFEDDPSGARSSSNVYIWRSEDAGQNWIGVFSQALNSDYLGTYGDRSINVVATFDTAITSQDWLIGWTPVSGEGGARLMEVDAATPEPATMGLVALFGGGLFLVRRIFQI